MLSIAKFISIKTYLRTAFVITNSLPLSHTHPYTCFSSYLLDKISLVDTAAQFIYSFSPYP